jgi:transposase InsO family protein
MTWYFRVMADRVVSMDVRLAIAAFALVDDGSSSVSRVCRELGISRDTYYRYRRRFEESGWVGLLPLSSRPKTSPGQTPPEVVELILRLRRELLEQGWDAGARSIHARLDRAGVPTLPSPRTVHRVLTRAGLITPQPAKRPRSSYRRFEHPAPNACWQMDGTTWHLADGTLVWILRVIDDHSRLILASLACEAESSVNAWTCMNSAITRHGAPAMVLTDGGKAFTSRRAGPGEGIGDFEARLRAVGIHPVVSSPYHPQTCGKKEREWATLKRWLSGQPAPKTMAELQRLLDAYDALFNTDRPHQGIGGQTPAERYNASPKATPADQPTSPPCQITHPMTSRTGAVSLGNTYLLPIGRSWAGIRVTVIRDDLDVVVLHEQTIICRTRIDPTRRFQRRGQPTAERRKNPVLSEPS